MKTFSYSMGNFRNHNNECKVIPRPQLNKIISEDQHKVTQYGMLNRVVVNHLKKKKKKKTNNKPIITFREQFTNEIDHCKSLDKMQSVNSERNEDIKRHIQQKAMMYTQNEELRQMLMNPSLKEHELHSKIYQLEQQVNNLKLMLQEKDVRHQEQIINLKQKHRNEIEILNGKINNKQQAQYQQQNNKMKYYSPHSNIISHQRQANNIKAINYSPPKNVSYSPSNKKYQTERAPIATAKTYSPTKNIAYHQSYQHNQQPKFVENQNYNPKIVTYQQHKTEITAKTNNILPPNTISNQNNQIERTYINSNNRQSNTITYNNNYNNNIKTITQQANVNSNKLQSITQTNLVKSQNAKENYIVGAPMYISSKNKQSGQEYTTTFAKNNQNKVQLSKNSQNTTNQTLTSNKSQGIIAYQKKELMKPTNYYDLQRQQHTRMTKGGNLNVQEPPIYSTNITVIPSSKSNYRTGQGIDYKGYKQDELQEIYKKYCID